MSPTATYVRPFFDALYVVTPRLGGRVAYSDLQWECGEEVVTSRGRGVACLRRDVLSEGGFAGEFAELEIALRPDNPPSYDFSFSFGEFTKSDLRALTELPFLGYGIWCNPDEVAGFHRPGATMDHLRVQLQDRLEVDIVRALLGDPSSPEKTYEALRELNAYAFASWGILPVSERSLDSATRNLLIQPVESALEFMRAITLEEVSAPTSVTAAAVQLKRDDVMAKIGAIHSLNRIAEEAGSRVAAVVNLLSGAARSLNPGETAVRSPVAQAIVSALSNVTEALSPPRIDLSSADLHGVAISHADFANAILKDVHLEHSTLSQVSLRGADLRDTDLTGAHLFATDISDAVYDSSTRWPEGFDPIAAGARLVE